METQRQHGIEHAKLPEGKNERERLSMVATGAVLRWMDALTRHAPEFRRPAGLTRSRELGAAFVASTLFTAVTGCYEFRTINCSPEDQEFMQGVVFWISEHPDEIQSQMDALWPNSTITAQQMIDTLMVAEIKCGVEKPDIGKENNDAAGEARFFSGTIVVDVNESYYQTSLNSYLNNSWVNNYSEEELIDTASSADFEDMIEMTLQISEYFYSMHTLAELLAHEAVHLTTDESHDKEKENMFAQQIDQGVDTYELPPIDQVYAWGFAARFAVDEHSRSLHKEIYDGYSEL